MKKLIFVLMLLIIATAFCGCTVWYEDENEGEGIVKSNKTGGVYEVDNLDTYYVPEWYRDAKFGIFIHYGVYSVPAYGDEWYGHWMYMNDTSTYGGSDIYNYHLETYGGASTFGYKDFIPEFVDNLKTYKETNKAQEWATLFSNAGAKYVMPVGIHHDSFALYDSDVQTTYNSVAQAGVDYVGDLQSECQKLGMKFGISNHFAENDWFFDDAYAKGTDLALKNKDGSLVYGELYGDGKNKSSEHLHKWYDISMEIIEKYSPDIIYYDFDLSKKAFNKYADANRYLMLAEYYNHGLANNPDGVVCCNKYGAFTEAQALLDKERSSLSTINPTPWQTDTSVGKKSWGYTTDDVYRSGESFIGLLVDVVSKNGNLLLNVGPRADGTVPKEVEDCLLTIGNWLNTYGDAIYSTRPWLLAGEGPTTVTTDEFAYTVRDIRFTRSKDNSILYATALAYDGDDNMIIETLKSGKWDADKINKVSLINGKDRIALKWKQTENGLEIDLSGEKPSGAYAVEITFKDGKIPPIALNGTASVKVTDSFNSSAIEYGTSKSNGSYTAKNQVDGAYFDVNIAFTNKVDEVAFTVSGDTIGTVEVWNVENNEKVACLEVNKKGRKYRTLKAKVTGDVDNTQKIRVKLYGNVELECFRFIQKKELGVKIDATQYDDKSGSVQIEATSDIGGGESLGYVKKGDWVSFKNVDFMSGGKKITLRAGADNKRFNVYIDKMRNRKKIASGTISTGGYNVYQDVTVDIATVTGVHDVYIEFVDGDINLNWFELM